MTTLADLWVGDPKDDYRSATVGDVVETLQTLGAEIVEADTCDSGHVGCTTIEVFDVVPGSYLVFRI